MSVFKKVSAFLTAVCVTAAFTGCSNTRYGMVVDDYTVPAGVYIYYANSAYNVAASRLAESNPDLDTTSRKAVKEYAQTATIEDINAMDWIQNKTKELCLNFVATEKKFDELGLELDADTKTYLESMIEYYWANYQENLEENGVSEDSFRKILTSSYKSEVIFEHYYGVGGEKGVTDEELRDYFAENTIRCQYVKFDLLDEEENLMKSDEKAEMMKTVKAYETRVQDAFKDGGVDAVMLEMDKVQEEYTASLNPDEEGEEEADLATEDETGETAEETNAETDAETVEETAEETTAEETVAETTEESEAAESETEAENAALTEETADSSTEESSDSEETETEAVTEETVTETEAVEETTEMQTEEASEASEDETAETEETTEEDADTEESDAETEEGHDTANEKIISIINKDDYEEDEEINYTPSEKVYNALLDAEYGDAFIVEEDEAYYLVVRYDITDRMTEDDLWSESQIYNIEIKLYDDDFQDMVTEWASALNCEMNAAAVKRYDPFKLTLVM